MCGSRLRRIHDNSSQVTSNTKGGKEVILGIDSGRNAGRSDRLSATSHKNESSLLTH